MKVVHVAKQFAPSIGGLEDAVLNLVRQQRERQGVDATVVTLDRLFADPGRMLPARDEVRSIPVVRVPWSGSRRYPLAPSVLSKLSGADLVHVHGIDFFFDYLAATKPVHRRPLVATTHGGFFHTAFAAGPKKLYFATVTRAAAACYRRVIGSSEADTALFSQICSPARLRCIENGVDVVKFRDAAASVPERRMIYFGRFASHKGILYLLALLAALRAGAPGGGLPNWELIVAGGPGDLPAARIAAEAERLGVGGAVRIVDSPDEAALRLLIGECSYFACASEHEGFGLAAVEAMSAGLIPLLSPLPTFRDFVGKAGAGILLEGDAAADARSVAGADAALRAGNTDWRARVTGTAARYGWTAAADRYLEEYRAALG